MKNYIITQDLKFYDPTSNIGKTEFHLVMSSPFFLKGTIYTFTFP